MHNICTHRIVFELCEEEEVEEEVVAEEEQEDDERKKMNKLKFHVWFSRT